MNSNETLVRAERKTVHRWFWVWEFEKEEAWLNQMAQEGWVLDRVSWCRYGFRACAPGEYGLRMEMRGADADYLDFMADTGAEYVGRVVQWIYFRKPTEKGEFNLFSDLDSRIQHLSRIGNMLLAVGGANLLVGISGHQASGWLNLLCATLVMYALGRIHGKKEALEQQRALQE